MEKAGNQYLFNILIFKLVLISLFLVNRKKKKLFLGTVCIWGPPRNIWPKCGGSMDIVQ